jgi:hypothetical protein
MNLFEITNLSDLQLSYRLLRIDGLPEGDHYSKQLNLLVKSIIRETRNPVSRLRRGDIDFVVVPCDSPTPKLQRQLTPHVAELHPMQGDYTLKLDRLNQETERIALDFLRFKLDGPLMWNRDLWGRGRRYYSKKPVNADRPGDRVDIYPGFAWNLVLMEDGRIYIAVDMAYRYIERAWFLERSADLELRDFLRRHFLYHFGHQWYTVQFWGITGRSISDQSFMPDGFDVPVDVYTYTKNQDRDAPPLWLQNLDPESPAIIYRYPGNELERYGALALCKLSLPPYDPQARKLHHLSILPPKQRLKEINRIIEQHFQSAKLGNTRIRVSKSPLEIERKVFPVPAQRFGKDQILSINGNLHSENLTVVALESLGQKRMQLLISSEAGPLDITPFDTQYIFLPRSANRSINQDFESRFILAVQEISARSNYTLRRILYDDREAKSLYQQVQAIKMAVRSAGITRGYALLVLPVRAHPDLHNYIKKELWPDIQFQCVTMEKIASFYRPSGDGRMRVKSEMGGRYKSYIRNCALAMMVVNRKWPWALESPLHYDVYIGIDVLNGIAGFTFVYERGRKLYFQDYPSKNKERLTAKLLRGILIEQLAKELPNLSRRPESIVIHRDGRTFPSEMRGLRVAIKELIKVGLLPAWVKVGIVEVRKTMADNLRIFEGVTINAVDNPTIGSYRVLRNGEGVVCTTGMPFWFKGTSKPLSASIVEGDLITEWVLEDISALSHLVFTAPDKCMRLPATLKFADDFLEPIAAAIEDEEDALYDEDREEDVELAELNAG